MKVEKREIVLSILVADDNEINRLVLEEFLKRLGHRVVLASDGAEAVDAFRRTCPDIVLMDVLMPVMDGFEVARRIRAMCGRTWVPIIFVTDLGNDDHVVQGLHAGGDDYMPKPVNQAVLGAKLRAVIRTLTLQRKLNDSLRRTQAISDSVVDAIVTINDTGMICSCNRATESLFGREEEELLGKNAALLVPEAHRGRLEEVLGRLRASTLPATGGSRLEAIGLRRDGTTFPVELGISELQMDDQRLFVGVVRDISERRAAEARLKENAERLRRYHEAQEAENAFARELLDKLLYRNGLEDPRLQWAVEGAEHFSGDIVAAARSPAGQLFVMLADATGHGLTSTISLVPTLSTFYAMVARNLPLSLIVQELNAKLRREMPSGRFVAATLLCMDEQSGRGEIWMGGMPPVLWVTNDGRIRRQFASNQPALGIIEDQDFAQTEPFHWREEGQIVMCSDGLFEAQNASGEPFGMERLVSVLTQAPPAKRWDAAWDALRRHLNEVPAQDDVSLVFVHCVMESGRIGYCDDAPRNESSYSAV